MLCITLLPGDHFTVGSDTVIQFDWLSDERIHLIVNAPKTVPILRGEVLERQGGKRPDCVKGYLPAMCASSPGITKRSRPLPN